MLREVFDDAQRAAGYLGCGLVQVLPPIEVDVILFSGLNHPARTLHLRTSHLEPTLERFANHMPSHNIEVLFDPEKKKGVIGVMRCYCERAAHCGKLPSKGKRLTDRDTGRYCKLRCREDAVKPQAIVIIPDGAFDSPSE